MKTFLLILLPFFAFSQNDSVSKLSSDSIHIFLTPRKKNDIYIEAGGHGILGNIGYERKFFINQKWGLGTVLGFELYPSDGLIFGLVPQIRIFRIIKLRNELSARFGVLKFVNPGYRIVLSQCFEYSHLTKNDFMFGVGLSIIILNDDNYILPIPWPGFRFGYCF